MTKRRRRNRSLAFGKFMAVLKQLSDDQTAANLHLDDSKAMRHPRLIDKFRRALEQLSRWIQGSA